MNKVIRVLLITFGVCLAVGGGLMIAGIALGGTWDDATVQIGDDEYDVHDMFDHGLIKFGGSTHYSDDSDMPETTNELTEAAKEIRDLEMTLRSCELQILSSEDDQIRVEIENGMEKYFNVLRKDEKLTIYDKRKTNKHLKAAHVKVQIPSDYVFDEVEMVLGAGDVNIECLAAKQLTIEGGAGKIEADTLIAAGELDAEIGAGDFYIKEAVLGETSIECGVGRFEIGSCSLNGDAEIGGGVGDVNIGITGEKEDFNYELSCGMGELSVFGDSYTSLGKNKEIDNHASHTISLECGVGRVNVYQAGASL